MGRVFVGPAEGLGEFERGEGVAFDDVPDGHADWIG